jgi:hypothetical protein
MRKLFAHKQGLPGSRAPLVQEVRVMPGALYAAATDALVPRQVVKGRFVDEPPRWVRFPDAIVL